MEEEITVTRSQLVAFMTHWQLITLEGKCKTPEEVLLMPVAQVAEENADFLIEYIKTH